MCHFTKVIAIIRQSHDAHEILLLVSFEFHSNCYFIVCKCNAIIIIPQPQLLWVSRNAGSLQNVFVAPYFKNAINLCQANGTIFLLSIERDFDDSLKSHFLSTYFCIFNGKCCSFPFTCVSMCIKIVCMTVYASEFLWTNISFRGFVQKQRHHQMLFGGVRQKSKSCFFKS